MHRTCQIRRIRGAAYALSMGILPHSRITSASFNGVFWISLALADALYQPADTTPCAELEARILKMPNLSKTKALVKCQACRIRVYRYSIDIPVSLFYRYFRELIV